MNTMLHSGLYENHLSGKKCKRISCIIICIIHVPLFKSNLDQVAGKGSGNFNIGFLHVFIKFCQILESAYDFQDFNRVL